MTMKTAMAVAILGTLVSGCLGPDPLVGTGAVNLSPGVQKGFAQYKEERAPGHFAVSADGSYAFYNYCPDGRCYRGSKNNVIYRCEQGSNGSPCKIYAAYGEVVWLEAEPAAN